MRYECRHIMPNGSRCHCPAMHGKPYCYFHLKLHDLKNAPRPKKKDPIKLNVMEDRSAIQIAVAQVLDALGSSRLDARTAGIFLYGIQLVSQNVERKTDILPYYGVAGSMTTTRDGEDLAPPLFVCDLSDDCHECPKRNVCTDPENDAKEDCNQEEG